MKKLMLMSSVVLAMGLWIAGWPGNSSAEMVRQTIANNTGQDANDLHLVFAQSTFPGAPALVKGSDVKITPQVNPKNAATVKANADQFTADFPQNSFKTIESGNTANEKATIDFVRPGDRNTKISTTSYWTLDGTKTNNVTIEGNPIKVGFLIGPGGTTDAYAQFTNPEPYSETYTGVALYTNNTDSNYNLDNFTTLTGTLVSGIPSTFELGAAGTSTDSMTFSFGSIDPGGYELALGVVAPTSNLSDAFPEATANAVLPEPASLVLFGVGMTMVACFAWAKRGHRRLKPACQTGRDVAPYPEGLPTLVA
jgi:hypothetical protein